MTDIHVAAAKGFEVGADAYERGRPEYPSVAVERLCNELNLSEGKTVVDLGAGTGKFTKLLSSKARAKILAIEPVEGMRKKFKSILPEVEILHGSAETIPLQDHSVDAVIAAQAFHWFDGEKTLQEIHRVLKPNGMLGLIWNVRDESKSWVAALTDIIDPYEGGAPRYKSGKWKTAFLNTPLFTKLSSAEYRHVHSGTPDTVVDRVASISFIAALPDAVREQVVNKVKASLQNNPETKARATIEFPYRTDIFWCQKQAS